jgi:acylphosphatase
MQSRARIVASGIVQGVFFRAFVRDAAASLGITGFVMNRPDGKVEAVAEGERHKVMELIGSCRNGPEGSIVKKVDVSWEEPTGEFTGFVVRR